ncbi:MFS transporter [Pseudonocardia alaniniphila]|uniref:MFS transporter n=1 Tax=Pseudonocardia alaniniphila TaxID=75291 RepID=A0ABS9T8I2_9PSEU|nr:MFS transporter [Pseudonocardia alaniniphila]MCH6164829.1 MFS transporter [Pseudonocardia alaniniphila]
MPELDQRRKMAVLAICCMGLFIVGLDNTIVNLALPSIGNELQASVSSLQWVIDAYTVVLASFLMLAGSTGDRIGRKRVFQTGLVLFSLGSLLCSIAPGIGLLIVFRMLQAVGGSMLNPVALSIITNVFMDRRERAKAIGVWGAVVGLSWALGPVLGGLLVDSIGWRSVFWINVPIGLAAVLLVARFVPESRSARPRPIDPVGQLLLIVLLATLTYGIIEAPGQGIESPWIIASFLVAVASAIAFVGYERRVDEPLLNMRFFASPPFTGATLIAIGSFAVMSGFLFLNALYLQEVRGYSPLHAGLLTLPMAVMTGVLAPLSGRLVGTHGPRIPLAAGAVAITAGSLLLSVLTAQSSVVEVVLAYTVFGIGFGFINPPVSNAAVSGMPASQAGVAAAVASTSRQVGATLGVAVLGSVVTARIVGPLSTGFVAAAHLGWLIMAGAGVAMFVIGVVTTGKWGMRKAQVFDEEFPQDVPVAQGVAVQSR